MVGWMEQEVYMLRFCSGDMVGRKPLIVRDDVIL